MGMTVDSGGSAAKKRPQPEVNVTPLVDIALVVLIIFMVVTPMVTKTFWLNVPRKPEAERAQRMVADDQETLVMTVAKDGTVKVNETVLSRDEIAERLPRMLAAQEQKVLYFDAHDELPYGSAVEVMDLARAGGAGSIAIITQNVAR